MSTDDLARSATADRLASLSPEKRALLARKLAERSAAKADVAGANKIPRRGDTAPVPLTHAQELVWLYEQMTPGTPTYNVPVARSVKGTLHIDRLERAVTLLVARHESLRMSFREADGMTRQAPAEAIAIRAEVHDLRGDASGANATEIENILREGATRPFDLAHGAYPRAVVIHVGDAVAMLLFVFHHIAFDGGSIAVFLKELSLAYDAIGSGTAVELHALPIQFSDYAAWERPATGSDTVSLALAFWRKELDGAPSGLDMPLDAPRPSAGSGPGARYVTLFSAAFRDDVRALAARHRATPFMVMLAALQAVLHRYTGQADIVVGTPAAGRSRPETEGMIGYLVNMLALRTNFADDPPFGQLLERVRGTALRAFAHQDAPIDVIVSELRAKGGSLDQSLFQVALAYQNAASAPDTLGDLLIEPAAAELGTSKFDFLLSLTDVSDGLRASVEYRSDLFREDTLARLLGHLEMLIKGAVRAPETPVSRLPLLTLHERAEIDMWNDTARAFPRDATLASLMSLQVARTPDAIAVSDDRTKLSFAALDRASDSLARVLAREGVGAGSLVAVCAERSVELVVALVAVVKAGGAYVPLDPDYPADRVAFMLEDSAPPVLLSTRALVQAHAHLASNGARFVSLDGVADPVAPRDDAMAPLPAPSVTGAAYMIYTSGSTGRPKGAINTHAGIVNRLLWMQDEYALRPADVVLQKTPFSFDVSVWEFFWPLISGATLVMAAPGGHRDPAYLANAIVAQGVTVCHFVPSMLRAFLDDDASAACTTLRDVMASGEALPPALVAQFHRRLPGARLHNLYGPTECAVDVSYWPCPQSTVPPAVVPIGRPVANTALHVLDAHLQPTPIGVAGELFLGGVQVGAGYYHRPELTAERFIGDPFNAARGARMYRTGDRARWLADGTVEYLGRLDFQVKLRGVRIELGEIESALMSRPEVASAVAVVREDGGEVRLVAYVVPAPDAIIDTPALLANASKTLPASMLPSAVVILAVLPLTPSGKVDRAALPIPAYESSEDVVAPRNDVETVVADVWKGILGREVVNVCARFMELGGHSLLATRVVAQLGKIFRVSLPLRRFFEVPTVEGIAQALVELEAKPGQTATIATLLLKARRMSPEERDRLRRVTARDDITLKGPQ